MENSKIMNLSSESVCLCIHTPVRAADQFSRHVFLCLVSFLFCCVRGTLLARYPVRAFVYAFWSFDNGVVCCSHGSLRPSSCHRTRPLKASGRCWRLPSTAGASRISRQGASFSLSYRLALVCSLRSHAKPYEAMNVLRASCRLLPSACAYRVG